MKFTVEKPKTWKGLSYPLKTSMLKDAIDNSKIDCNIDLNYWTPQQFDETYNILECEFWGANSNVDYDRFFIRAGVVKSEDRKLAETLLRNEVIPKLIEFISSKVSQAFNSTLLSRQTYFKAVFINKKIIIYN